MNRYSSKNYRRLGLRRSDSPKDPTVRRSYPPGLHGPKGKPRLTQYGSQLAEKQKAKVIYNLSEKQLKNYYATAIKMVGDTGEIMQQLIEARFDNVIYRLGWTRTRPQARQLINHCFFAVNGKKTNIPSYRLGLKDEITLREQKGKKKIIEEIKRNAQQAQTPSWFSSDNDLIKAKVVDKPKPEEMELRFNARSIVEFYSR